MRKALLTSSEVSALVSICVVILFTLALFLSGYALQQRTLRDLRVAIRPGHTRPSPKAYLPSYFKRETTKLQDGTIIVGQSQADVDEKEQLAKKYELRQVEPKTKSNVRGKDTNSAKLTDEEPETQQEEAAPVGDPEGRGPATEEQLRILSTLKTQAARQAWGVDHPDPLAKNPLPITRAERRKLIKEEIQRLAQVDRPVYYQRRLW
ncbi:hypothetical protein C2857_005188 [Epichloe festucae Fl1]|uniref:Uncharacterized protein n=1 Tax=Epichloe festucae (strain Fl1) TaxID=877507 RepID=A0A7S9PU41_EPIFF|nr:hypothetical protein C2857_005188 [Epichloe festucae Fl1]